MNFTKISYLIASAVAGACAVAGVFVALSHMAPEKDVAPLPELMEELRVKGAAAMPVDGLDYVYVTARLTNPDRICTSMLKNANTPPLSMHCYPVYDDKPSK